MNRRIPKTYLLVDGGQFWLESNISFSKSLSEFKKFTFFRPASLHVLF